MFEKIEQYGDQAILISWKKKINKFTSYDISIFNQKIQQVHNHEIIETVQAYCSLTIYVRGKQAIETTIIWLKGIYTSEDFIDTKKSKTWKIPVCYDEEFGIDLRHVAKQAKVNVNDVVELHCECIYRVEFIGFLPGFPYLSGLNSKLYTPRLKKPRASIPQGSVAIGGCQTGIYPVESPAGWHVIGRTPVKLFDSSKQAPCFIKPMDKIKLLPITRLQFDKYSND